MSKRPQSTRATVQQHSFTNKLRDASSDLLYKILIYGPSRAGKTTFSATAGYDEGRAAPALLLDFEGGSGSAVGIPNLAVATMRDWKDFNEACAYIVSDANQFKTVIIDSVSELHIFSLINIIDSEIANNSKRAERGDENTPEQSDYGKSLVQMRRFLRIVRDLPTHIILTSLSKTDDYPREGRVRVPAMFGQLAGELVGMFPIVGYLINEKSSGSRRKTSEPGFQRKLYLQNQEGMRVGVRGPINAKIPDVLDNPTVPRLFNMLDNIYKEK